jgi:hypothetical protein
MSPVTSYFSLWFLRICFFNFTWLLKLEKQISHQLWVSFLWLSRSVFVAASKSHFSHLNLFSLGDLFSWEGFWKVLNSHLCHLHTWIVKSAESLKTWRPALEMLTHLKRRDNLNFKAVLLILFNNKNLKNKWFWHHRDWPSYLRSQWLLQKLSSVIKFNCKMIFKRIHLWCTI